MGLRAPEAGRGPGVPSGPAKCGHDRVEELG